MESERCHRIGGLACVLMVGICAACYGQVIYVDDGAAPGGDGSSWAHACRYLQDALAQAAGAAGPVEIRVAQGVYQPDQGAGVTPGDRAATFELLNGDCKVDITDAVLASQDCRVRHRRRLRDRVRAAGAHYRYRGEVASARCRIRISHVR
jgi:hypothetical protein